LRRYISEMVQDITLQCPAIIMICCLSSVRLSSLVTRVYRDKTADVEVICNHLYQLMYGLSIGTKVENFDLSTVKTHVH